MAHPSSHHQGHHTRHEDREVKTRPVVAALAGLIVMALVCAGIVYGLLAAFGQKKASQQQPLSPVMIADQTPPEPRLQQDPRGDLKTMLKEEDGLLTSYGWADASKAAVRIPVEQAMQMIAKKGLPARSSEAKTNAAPE